MSAGSRASLVALAAAHIAGNALLLWLGYYWLGVGESDGLHLAWSTIVVLVLACGTVWLHGMALAYFASESERRVSVAAKTAWKHLLPLLVLATATLVVYGLTAYLRAAFDHSAFLVGSYATMRLRKPVAPSAVLRGFYAFIWLLRWVVIPVLLFPLAAAVAKQGWSGFRRASFARSKRVLYWAEVCVLLLLAIWVPLKLEAWVPNVEQFAMQMTSFGVRAIIAYLLFVLALLALEFVTSVGKPRSSQVSAAAAP
jgi:hypothetical protein